MALALETLERRLDQAFQVERTEDEHNQRLASRVRILEHDLQIIGDSMATDDDRLTTLAHYERWFKEHGIDPWSLDDV
jgi:hypothetical protein